MECLQMLPLPKFSKKGAVHSMLSKPACVYPKPTQM